MQHGIKTVLYLNCTGIKQYFFALIKISTVHCYFVDWECITSLEIISPAEGHSAPFEDYIGQEPQGANQT